MRISLHRNLPAIIAAISLFAWDLEYSRNANAQSQLPAQTPPVVLQNEFWKATIAANGHLLDLSVRRQNGWEKIPMRNDAFAGVAWIWKSLQTPVNQPAKEIPLARKNLEGADFSGSQDGVDYTLAYELSGDELLLKASVKNRGTAALRPERAGLQLGIDTAMAHYPDWDRQYFPTLLRCEATHFWGYLMTPNGSILTISSPDAIASWHLDYNNHSLFAHGHRIFTVELDLLNAKPLPARHPQNLDALQPNASRQWTIILKPVETLADVKPVLAKTINAPMIDADRYTVQAGEPIHVQIDSQTKPEVSLASPEGMTTAVQFTPNGAGVWNATIALAHGFGVYSLTAKSGGHESQALFSLIHPWSWYLEKARDAAYQFPQKASASCESFYGFYSAFLGHLYFPNPKYDAPLDQRFHAVYNVLYDPANGEPRATGKPGRFITRIQNHATMAGILVDRYRAYGDVRDLEAAATLCDFLMKTQSADGAYRDRQTYYTSVIYIAKSIMEVMAQEKPLTVKSTPDAAIWKQRYDRQLASVKAAMDDLVRRGENIQTEGEMTFEDGMISCSYTQLAMFALYYATPQDRPRYVEAAEKLVRAHRCLSQLLIPDSRMNGASLRFWEAQYNVLADADMMNSPCGWSAWRIYGLWYLYQITGNVDDLRDAMNALGSCVQVIDGKSGTLRWAFISDPYIRTRIFLPNPNHSKKPYWEQRVIGEQYLPMISDWWTAPADKWVTANWGLDGGSVDNLVHEIFKCEEEIALTSAYVVESANGDLETWNCRAEKQNGVLVVTTSEAVVSAVNYNLKSPEHLRVIFANRHPVDGTFSGLGWIR